MALAEPNVATAYLDLHLRYGEGWEGVCEMREMVDVPGGHG